MMDEELKTLKDLKHDYNKHVVWRDELKKEAIKWVKEDLKRQVYWCPTPSPFLKRWMKRLNITSEDLK